MKVFIPTNEINEDIINQGYSFRPFDISAYAFHLSDDENTQKVFRKKVTNGTVNTNKGNA